MLTSSKTRIIADTNIRHKEKHNVSKTLRSNQSQGMPINAAITSDRNSHSFWMRCGISLKALRWIPIWRARAFFQWSELTILTMHPSRINKEKEDNSFNIKMTWTEITILSWNSDKVTCQVLNDTYQRFQKTIKNKKTIWSSKLVFHAQMCVYQKQNIFLNERYEDRPGIFPKLQELIRRHRQIHCNNKICDTDQGCHETNSL